MTTTATTVDRPVVKTRRWNKHTIRAAFNKNVLKFLAIGVFLFLYVPIIILIAYSFNENRFVSTWTGFSTQWYSVLFQDSQMGSALRLSLWVAGWSTVISTILGTLAAMAMERYRFRGKLAFDGVLYLPIIIPDIAMALSTLLFFVIMGIALSRNTILITHVAFNIAFVAIIVRARLATMDDDLEEAAADLGANEWITFRRITLPLLMPGIVAAALLAFTLSIDDFVISFFVAGPGSTTLPVRVYSMIRFGLSPEVNAASTLMFIGSTILVVISLLVQRR
jgi:spermidine/putrescine transport system permease protein